MLRKAIDWILVTSAVRDARARLAAEDQRTGAQLQQARLVAEVMKRVAEPAETLPPGNRAAIVLALGREAVTAILAVPPAVPTAGDPPAAAGSADGALAAEAPPAPLGSPPATPEPPPATREPPDVAPEPPVAALDGPARSAAAALPLAEALDRAPPEMLMAAAPDVPTLGLIKEALLAPPTTVDVAASEQEETQAASVRRFVEALLWNADAPRRRVDQLLVFRLARLTLVALVLALIAFGVYKLTRGSNLAAGKPWKTSTQWTGCAADPTCEGVLLFHTVEENQPWAELDLLKPKTIHRIEVKNRTECCADRIAPLVVEVSLDGKQWTEVGRKKEEFVTWSTKFPPRPVRYIKLHIARVSTLHIKDLIVE